MQKVHVFVVTTFVFHVIETIQTGNYNKLLYWWGILRSGKKFCYLPPINYCAVALGRWPMQRNRCTIWTKLLLVIFHHCSHALSFQLLQSLYSKISLISDPVPVDQILCRVGQSIRSGNFTNLLRYSKILCVHWKNNPLQIQWGKTIMDCTRN